MTESFAPLQSVDAARLSGPALRAFLSAPLPRVGIEDIARHWRTTTISLLLKGDFNSLAGHDIARKIRGALWPVLQRQASPEAARGEPCPRQPLSLLDLLWNEPGKITRGRDIPHPFVTRGVVDLADHPGEAVVHVLLFGIAGCFAERLLLALIESFACGVGADDGRPAWRLAHRNIAVDAGVAVDIDAVVDQAVMHFRSPVTLKRDGAAVEDWRGLLTGLVDRVEGLAFWHGLRLDCDFTALKADARAARVHDADISDRNWGRHSSRAGREIPMHGRQGSLLIEGRLDRLVPYLLIGEAAQIGHDTRHGHGWYDVELWGAADQ